MLGVRVGCYMLGLFWREGQREGGREEVREGVVEIVVKVTTRMALVGHLVLGVSWLLQAIHRICTS